MTEQRSSVAERDKVAMRAFHCYPHARVVAVLADGTPLFFDSPHDISKTVPAREQARLKFYTPSFVLGRGGYWKWIEHLYRGRVPPGSQPTEAEE